MHATRPRGGSEGGEGRGRPVTGEINSATGSASAGFDASAILRRERARRRTSSAPYAAATRRHLTFDDTSRSKPRSPNPCTPARRPPRSDPPEFELDDSTGAVATNTNAKDRPVSSDAGITRYVHIVPSAPRSRQTIVCARGRLFTSCAGWHCVEAKAYESGRTLAARSTAAAADRTPPTSSFTAMRSRDRSVSHRSRTFIAA